MPSRGLLHYIGAGHLKFKLMLSAGVLGTLVIVLVFGWRDVYSNLMEMTPPTIKITKLPRGIGLAPTVLQVEVFDSGSGINHISVTQEQGHKKTHIIERQFNGSKHESFAVQFIEANRDLENGPFKMTIEAGDRSLWKQSASSSLQFLADFLKPEIKILFVPEKMIYGHTGLLFYTVQDEHAVTSGLTINETLFKGYSADLFDSDLSSHHLYVIPFTIPVSSSPNQPKMRLFAEDSVGNTTSLPIQITALPRTEQNFQETILPKDVTDDITPAIKAHFNSAKNNPIEMATFLKKEESSFDPLAQIQLFFGALRELDEVKTRQDFSQTNRMRMWTSPFLQQSKKRIYSFGTTLTRHYSGQLAGRYQVEGEKVVLNDQQKEVISVASGFVVTAEELATLGKTVVIDHGMGITTLYGNLDTISVRPGNPISKGSPIGLVKSFDEQRSFYFEINVSGEPVDPKGWWNPQEYHKNIVESANRIKRILNIPLRISTP